MMRALRASSPARRRMPGWCSPPRPSPRPRNELTVKVDGTDRKGNFNARYSDESLGGEAAHRAEHERLAGAIDPHGLRQSCSRRSRPRTKAMRWHANITSSTAPSRSFQGEAERPIGRRAQDHGAGSEICAPVDRRSVAGRARDRQSEVDGRRSALGARLAEAGVSPSTAEYRDDRFVVAVDRSPDQPAAFAFAYMVRAVSPGHYVHPPATVEDMYRPERYRSRRLWHRSIVAPAK